MAIINRWAKSIAKVLESSFAVSSSIADHKTILGDARESFIRDVLQRFLPRNISIGSGQIVDAEGGISKQIDLIIYRNDFPILRTFGSADVYLIEGVVATVEVKSQLNETQLFQALENGKSVRNLKVSITRESMDHYSQFMYRKPFAELPPAQSFSVRDQLLPPTYIYGYNGYTAGSLDKLRQSLNTWHREPLAQGEQDVILMPEVIATQGCVTLKNLNNILGLPRVAGEELEACRQAFNRVLGFNLDKREFLSYFRERDDQGFDYGIGLKTCDSPLQFLISSLLQTLTSRVGHPQLGSTAIQYDLSRYHLSEEMEGGWSGAAVNLTRISDPRLDFARANGF